MWKRFKEALALAQRKAVRYMDNRRLRTKMMIMCITCVLIPVIGTNLLFWNIVYEAEQDRIESQMEDAYVNTQAQLDSLVNSVATMAATFYTNPAVYEFLDTEYANDMEYYEAYRTYIEPLSVVYGNNTFINKFVLYADNASLINGGGVGRISSARNEEWYKHFKESGGKSAVCAYYDKVSEKRIISFIRKLDYVKGMNHELFVKLDVSYGYYSSLLSQQHFIADIYICNDDFILFSNADPSNGATPFKVKSEISESDAARVYDYTAFGTPLKILLYHSEESSDLSISSLIIESWPIFAALILINLLIPFGSIYIVSRSITGRLSVLGQHLDMVKEGRFKEIEISRSNDEIGELIDNYNIMTQKMRELIEDVYQERLRRQENELQKQRAELQALHSQINPHFMFNALESIRMRSLIKRENETAEIIELLAVMMRKSTDWGDDLVTVANEAAFAETYLKLQRYRFSDRLSYKINITPDCCDYRIPKLSLVTFVENACVHGVEGVNRGCIIIISVERDDEMLRIYVEDTGAGMSEERSAAILHEMREATFDDLRTSKSVGIINACLRLRKCFGNEIEFELDSEEGVGSCFTINIPLRFLETKNEGDKSC